MNNKKTKDMKKTEEKLNDGTIKKSKGKPKRKSKYPKWVLKYKKPGIEIRCIRGKYYVYKVTSKWDPDIKRSRKITGEYLGRITEAEGFISVGSGRSKRQREEIKSVQVKENGFSCFINNNLRDNVKLIEKHFGETWQTIVAISYGRLLYQSPLKNIGFHFGHSYLSEQLETIDLRGKNVGLFLKELGKQREKIVEYFKEYRRADDCILIDGTDIVSESRKMTKCKLAISKEGTYQSLINTMFIFSVGMDTPIYYRLMPGNIKDVKSFKLCLRESGIKEATIIVDKGFYSKYNIEDLDIAGLKYIMPLKRDNKMINYDIIKSGNKGNYEGYFKYAGRYIWYYTIKQPDGKEIYVYLDDELKMEEEKDYLKRIDKEIEGYEIERFYERQKYFGSIALYTNNAEKVTAEQAYTLYKSRVEVENMIDTFKNVLESDRTYMQDEETLEGWMFVNHIAMQWYYSLHSLLLKNNLLKTYSVNDILEALKQIHKVKINGEWYKEEITHKTEELMNKLGIPIT
jgi:transposase